MPLSNKEKLATGANWLRSMGRVGGIIFTTGKVMESFEIENVWLQLFWGLFVALCVVPIAYLARQQKIKEYINKLLEKREKENQNESKPRCRVSILIHLANGIAVLPITVSVLVGTFAVAKLINKVFTRDTHKNLEDVANELHYGAIALGLLFAIGTVITFFLYQGHRSNKNVKRAIKEICNRDVTISPRFFLSWAAGLVAAFVYAIWCYFFAFYGSNLIYRLSHRHFGLVLEQTVMEEIRFLFSFIAGSIGFFTRFTANGISIYAFFKPPREDTTGYLPPLTLIGGEHLHISEVKAGYVNYIQKANRFWNKSYRAFQPWLYWLLNSFEQLAPLIDTSLRMFDARTIGDLNRESQGLLILTCVLCAMISGSANTIFNGHVFIAKKDDENSEVFERKGIVYFRP